MRAAGDADSADWQPLSDVVDCTSLPDWTAVDPSRHRSPEASGDPGVVLAGAAHPHARGRNSGGAGENGSGDVRVLQPAAAYARAAAGHEPEVSGVVGGDQVLAPASPAGQSQYVGAAGPEGCVLECLQWQVLQDPRPRVPHPGLIPAVRVSQPIVDRRAAG